MRSRIADRSATHFTPYFDFKTEAEVAVTKSAADRAADVIRGYCEAWLDAGNQIAPCGFGIVTRQCVRDYHGKLSGVYEAIGEICDPLGALLVGRKSTQMPVVDAANALSVDEFYVVGFIHGFDFSKGMGMVGKNLDKLEKNDGYNSGREAGREMRLRFVREEKAA